MGIKRLATIFAVVSLTAAGTYAGELHEAAKEGNKAKVERLLADGADVNAKDEEGRTPLHLAASQGHTDVAELLIAKGADVNVKDKYGQSPLKIAKEDEIKELLKKHGAKE